MEDKQEKPVQPKSQKAWALPVQQREVRIFQWHKRIETGGHGTRKIKQVDIVMAAEHFSGLSGIGKLLEMLGSKSCSGFTLAVKPPFLGVSICGKEDEFSKQRGITISFGRMNKAPFVYLVDQDGSGWGVKRRSDGLVCKYVVQLTGKVIYRAVRLSVFREVVPTYREISEDMSEQHENLWVQVTVTDEKVQG